MAIVKPFKGVLPNKNKIEFIPEDLNISYSKKELEEKLGNNPYSFLHIFHPDLHQTKNKEEHATQVLNKYSEFKNNSVFIKDEVASFYIYQKKTKNDTYCGIIGAISVEDYKKNNIKKHEGTLEKRELLFKQYLNNMRFNPDPVLLSYPDNTEINSIITAYTKQKPNYAFSSADDEKQHQIWKVEDTFITEKITQAFKNIDSLYIADGHHRSTSSCLLAETLAEENDNHTGKENYNYFMSYLLAESQLNIYEFNRFITDLNNLTIKEFLAKLKVNFIVENKGKMFFKANKKHQFSMYLSGDFYALTLREANYKFTDALSKLDAQILYATILKPILGINDIRNASKIKYSQNKSNGLELKTAVDSNEFVVSFGMSPVNTNELKEIVDAGLLMPPKTTYIEPKLRSGLTIYEF